MEIELTLHQDLTGAGPEKGTGTGTGKHSNGGNARDLLSLTGVISTLQGAESPDGFSVSPDAGQCYGRGANPPGSMPGLFQGFRLTARTATTPPGPAPGLSPGCPERTRKHTLVIGMGVLYNGEITPVVTGNPLPAPADTDAEEGEKDPVFPPCGRPERIADRLTKKIARLDRRLTLFEERRRS